MVVTGYQEAELAAKKIFLEAEVRSTSTGSIHVQSMLTALLHADEWDNQQQQFFDGWLKKLDIAKKHYGIYDNNWKPTTEKVALQSQVYPLSGLLALRYLISIANVEPKAAQVFKTINVLFKILANLDDVFGIKKPDIIVALEKSMARHRPLHCQTTEAPNIAAHHESVLPITVLFSEGPIARAYLETIKSMGLKVKKVVKLVSSIDLVTKKPVAPLLPRGIKKSFAANKQFNQMFYWANHLKKRHPAEVAHVKQQVCEQFSFESQAFDDASSYKDLSEYTTQVDELFITGLNDHALKAYMSKETATYFLFTGGGIVPDDLLDLEHKKLIHVHPGYLPDVRGADCVLWSQLLYHRTSASAFFLAPGIDVGDVILPCWLPEIKMNSLGALDLQLKYRLIYGFLDPWVRSYVLRQTLKSSNFLQDIKAVPQDETDGMTFHFMHNAVKKQAIDAFHYQR